MNEDDWKKAFLLMVCAVVILAYVFVGTDPTIEVKAKDGSAIHETTCLNAFNVLNAAKINQKMLNQQISLSTAAGRATEAAYLSAQVSELNAVMVVFEKLIDDPKLNCDVYLKETAGN